MPKSRYAPAQDNLIARVSGTWAMEKLKYVEKYMDIFSTGMKKNWATRIYVDLMSGPGRCVTDDGQEFLGSPLLALATKTAFSKIVLVEGEPNLADALKARVAASPRNETVEVLTGNCNDKALIARIRQLVPSDALALTFVDMLGLDVRLDTLARLTEGRRMDLAITFQIGDLKRNVGHALKNPGEGRRFDEFFGTENWRETAWAHRSGGMPFQDLATAFADFYEERLRTLGYPHVARSLDVMKNSKNVDLYRLLLASRHPRAVDFFEKISQISPLGERRLF
jgi:three-Cys-motif partner protein